MERGIGGSYLSRYVYDVGGASVSIGMYLHSNSCGDARRLTSGVALVLPAHRPLG